MARTLYPERTAADELEQGLVPWNHAVPTPSCSYLCGYCGLQVASNLGYVNESAPQDWFRVLICPHCERATFFVADRYTWITKEQYPGAPFGEPVEFLPESVDALYTEARRCMAVNAFTSAVLAARKLLMNVAVHQGAPGNQPFAAYVTWLSDHHYIPPGGEVWVDLIRTKGNEATHEIELMTESQAQQVITFVGYLLKIVFELPAKATRQP